MFIFQYVEWIRKHGLLKPQSTFLDILYIVWFYDVYKPIISTGWVPGNALAPPGWPTKEPWFHTWQGEVMFLLCKASRLAAGLTQPPDQWKPRAIFPRIMRLGREADCSPRSNVEVRMSGAIPPLPHTPSLYSHSVIFLHFSDCCVFVCLNILLSCYLNHTPTISIHSCEIRDMSP
jgi:hypothetical protein